MTAADQGSLVRRLTLVAFGGNALLQRGDLGTMAEQRRRAEAASAWLVDLASLGHDLLIVHGNGPQVGQVMIQMEEAATKIPPATLDVAVAQTQGSIGFLLELALRNRLRQAGLEREVTSILSEVLVDRDDPGFASPSKPIGPFFSRYRAHVLRRDHGWQMVEDAGRGWRKVVASPRPVEVLGLAAIRALLRAGGIVIAGGGGGIPVVRGTDGELVGVEAVIDKDHTAALLARELHADQFINLTGVDAVYKNFGRRNQAPLRRLPLAQARRMLSGAALPAGSMGPKVAAAADFVAATGNPALITDVDHLLEAVAGRAGTTVVTR